MKMRLLNGAHSALAYLGLLMQYETIDQVMEDPMMRTFLDRYFKQLMPLIPALPGVDLPSYVNQLIGRFANPFIGGRFVRVAGDGSAKLTKWTMPCASELLWRGLPFDSLALIVAAWFQCLLGEDEQEQEITFSDSRRAWLEKLVVGPDGLNRFLKESSLFTEDLRHSDTFQELVTGFVRSFGACDVQQTLQQVLSSRQ